MALKKVLNLVVINFLLLRIAADEVLTIDEKFCKTTDPDVTDSSVICKHIDARNYATVKYAYERLYKIYIHNSDLPTVPKNLVDDKVYVLKISNANLENITTEDFENGRYLRHLDLSMNRIRFLPKDAFVKSPLISLNLSNNQLQYLPDDLLTKHPVLFTVDFSFNQIKVIQKRLFPAKKRLQSVYFAHNTVTTIEPDAFLNTPIELLDVSNNNLTDSLDFLREMPDLVTLDLSGNCVGNPKPRTLAKNAKLEKLYLARSCLTRYFDYGAFPHESLKELDLSENDFHEIDYTTFIAIPHLEKLYLRDRTVELSTLQDLIRTVPLTEIELASGVYQCQYLLELVRQMRRLKVKLIVREPDYDSKNIIGLKCV